MSRGRRQDVVCLPPDDEWRICSLVQRIEGRRSCDRDRSMLLKVWVCCTSENFSECEPSSLLISRRLDCQCNCLFLYVENLLGNRSSIGDTTWMHVSSHQAIESLTYHTRKHSCDDFKSIDLPPTRQLSIIDEVDSTDPIIESSALHWTIQHACIPRPLSLLRRVAHCDQQVPNASVHG